MTTEKMIRVLSYAWKRWTMAERAYSRLDTRRRDVLRAERACEFWRGVHNAAEASLEKVVAPNRLAHAATARALVDAHFTRPPDVDLPESFPDLPLVNCGVMLRKRGPRHE